MKWIDQNLGKTSVLTESIRWYLEEQLLLGGGSEVTLWVSITSSTRRASCAWRQVELADQQLEDTVVVLALSELRGHIEAGRVGDAVDVMDLLATL
jgi:hypothetical protein